MNFHSQEITCSASCSIVIIIITVMIIIEHFKFDIKTNRDLDDLV